MLINRYLLIISLLFYTVLYSAASTTEVCESCDYNSIQDAVDNAISGDSIIIKAGVYKEFAIRIEKEIHLIGEENSIIDGENNGTIINVSAENFSIKGLTIKNVGISYTKDYAAILVSRSKYFTIENNILRNVFFGILIEKSKYGLIRNNDISSSATHEASSGNGVHLWHCSRMRIEQNKVSNLRDGIYLEFVENSSISNNESSDNIRYGLHFMFSNNDEYFKNEFRNNGAGVAVMFSKIIKMHHNTFHLNWGPASYGLLLKEITDADIENNLFEKNTIGINIDGCSRINYTNNHFVQNGWAIKFHGGCYENIFELNNFIHNSFDLSYSSRLNDNKFEGNYWSDYNGYDLDKDGIGDVPYRPVRLFSYVVNKTPETLVLLRSLFVDIINFSEKVSPVFTPENLIDNKPIMIRINDRN